ncbi:hypothetical protein IW261DRAFT_1033178 [Armillaria novae-zelandiae]|uniref:DUF6699 domain-containing protein n=1 Tax=Armillaria novae-zelandiae TaxID=153914 RepID=A0AA39PFM8_9AGAR|nr:hypothetical protein IW261DRAFT_1033178 [Armillaria novae-zelandiae]
MAGRFTYVPEATPYMPFCDPFTAAAVQNSPFIPSAALYPGTPSPYATNIPLPGGSPHLAPIPFPPTPGGGAGIFYDPAVGWVPPRQRRPSWNGPENPFITMPSGVRQRTNSFGGIGGQPDTHEDHFYNTSIYNLYQPNQQLPAQLQISPWLTTYAQAGYLHLDLSMAAFNPIRMDNMGMRTQLGTNELSNPATHPHVLRMTIVCDAMPYWPISIGDGNRGLSLMDVLQGIYQSMMWRVSRSEWEKFPEGDRNAIAKAFTRRCRALGNSQLENAERQDGVKRVDLLLGKTMLRGLAVDGGVFRLILS